MGFFYTSNLGYKYFTMNDSRIYTYRGYTLVDITNTGVTKYCQQQEKLRNQQRNWEAVNQLLGLRTQLMKLDQLEIIHKDVDEFEFGSLYTGIHKIWAFDFVVEYRDVYRFNDNEFKILIDDFNNVPIIVGLEETACFQKSLFYTYAENKNIYFNFIPNKV